MSEQHTPEPWLVSKRTVFALNERGTNIFSAIVQDAHTSTEELEANARRIVACVNACAGFSIEELEGASLFNDSISAQDEIDSLKSEVEEMKLIIATDTGTESAVAELRNELHESDLLRERMDRLLTRTACALKGDPAELSMHSWHDLPEVAERLKSQRDELLSAYETFMSHGICEVSYYAISDAIASVKANT